MKDRMGQPITKRAGCSFEEWKRRIDAYIYSECGMSSDDLPDWDYRDAYDDNIRPSVAARCAMNAADSDY
jgi:hypothetical protein